jgi:serine/threonine protein kinase
MKTVPKDIVSMCIGSRRIVEKEVFMRVFGKPFLVQLHSYFETKEEHCLVKDYMPGATMRCKIFQERYLSEKMARFYGAELTLAVEHLHIQGIVHQWRSLGFAAQM